MMDIGQDTRWCLHPYLSVHGYNGLCLAFCYLPFHPSPGHFLCLVLHPMNNTSLPVSGSYISHFLTPPSSHGLATMEFLPALILGFQWLTVDMCLSPQGTAPVFWNNASKEKYGMYDQPVLWPLEQREVMAVGETGIVLKGPGQLCFQLDLF